MVTHGRGGWELADYDWDPETGYAKLTYERLRTDTGEIQTKVRIHFQPTSSKHGDNTKLPSDWYAN